MKKLFVVVQLKQAKTWCWGSCGRAMIARVELLPGMPGILCSHEACPHLVADEPDGITRTVEGNVYDIHLRELEEIACAKP